MKARCYIPSKNGYERYGGRDNPITVFKAWLDNPAAYIEYISSLENAFENGYSIDRIDNDGNYEPGNLRWATKEIQMRNRGISKNNTSGAKGVCFNKRLKKWVVSLTANGHRYHLGYFSDKESAVQARAMAEDKHWGQSA